MDHGTLKCHVFSKDHFQREIVICQIQLPYKIIANVTIRLNCCQVVYQLSSTIKHGLVIIFLFCLRKKIIWLPNPGFCFSSLWILGVQKSSVASMSKQSILCAQKWISSNSPWPRSVCWYNGGEILQWGWEGAFFTFFLTYKVDQRHAALAHSYLYRMLLQKIPCTYLVFCYISICHYLSVFCFISHFLCPKPQNVCLYSKALPHQTASFLEGVPYGHLQSCLNYLILDPVFDMLLIENS